MYGHVYLEEHFPLSLLCTCACIIIGLVCSSSLDIVYQPYQLLSLPLSSNDLFSLFLQSSGESLQTALPSLSSPMKRPLSRFEHGARLARRSVVAVSVGGMWASGVVLSNDGCASPRVFILELVFYVLLSVYVVQNRIFRPSTPPPHTHGYLDSC